MRTKQDTPERQVLERRLKWLVAFRLMLATILVAGTQLAWSAGAGKIFATKYSIAIAITSVHLGAAFLFAILYRYVRIPKLSIFALGQVVWDLIFTSTVVYVTGGIASELKLLYWLPIAFAAILLYRTGAYVAASFSGLMYGILANLVYFKKLPAVWDVASKVVWEEQKVTNSIVLHTAGFFLAAYLFSYLSVGLRRAETTLEEKSLDLEDLEALMGRIVESLTSGLVTLDAAGNINYWSPAAEEITRLRATEVRGRSILEFFPGARGVMDSEVTRSDRNAARPWRFETTYKAPDGGERILGFSVSPLRPGKGSERGTLVLFQDLTTYKGMEAQVKRADRLAALGEVAARMAHEIRNPLTSMSGAIEVLQNRIEVDPDDHRLMQIVLRETDRLNSLLTDFLLFAKPSAPQFEEVDVARLLRDTTDLFEKSHHKTELKIRTEVKEELTVLGDSRQLSQLFWNLMKNGAEAMPSGGMVHLSLRREPRTGQVVFEISDEGAGISPEIRDRLFQPFFTTKTRGTGLGLAVAKRIADDHGAQISIESQVGRGTQISVLFPNLDATPSLSRASA